MTLTTFLVHSVSVILLFISGGEFLKWPLRYRKTVRNEAAANLKGHVSSGFYVSINIGTPAQVFDVILDTGSSNFAIAGRPTPFIENYYMRNASSSVDASAHQEVEINYVEGSWKGVLLSDIVSIPSAGLSTPVRVPVAEIQSSENFFLNNSNWQGILGLAYSEIVEAPGSHVRSFMDTVMSESGLRDMFSMQLCSRQLNDTSYGSFIIGDQGQSLGRGPLLWTPIVKESFYEIIITGMKVGNKKLDLPCTEFNKDKTILDSGTTNLRFPTAVYNAMVKLIKNSVTEDYFDEAFYNGSKDFCVDKQRPIWQGFPTLTIYLPSTKRGQTIVLTIYPQSYVQFVNNGTKKNQACYKFLIYPSRIGTVLGTVLMEQYFIVFDREKQKIGFAKSTCTWISEQSPLLASESGWINSTVCRYRGPSSSSFQIALYVLVSVLALLSVPTCFLLWKYFTKGKPVRLCCKEDQFVFSELREH